MQRSGFSLDFLDVDGVEKFLASFDEDCDAEVDLIV